MAEQATNKIAHSLTGLHSMQSLGWGAVAMNQLAQLINWSGSENFKPVAVDPWTALISINSEPIQADATSAAQAPSPTTSNADELSPAINSVKTPSPTEAEKAAAEVERVAAEKLAAEKLAAEKLAAEKLAIEKAAEEKAAADAQAKAVAERLAVAAAEQAALEKEKEEALKASAVKAAADQRASAEKAAAEKLAAEQMATEQEDADQKAAEREAALQRAAEQRAAEVKAAEQKAAEQKAAEQKAAEQKAAEQKAAEQRAAEQRAAEQKAAEQKAAEQKAAEQKAAEQKAAETVAAGRPATAAAQPVVRSVSQPTRTNMPATARTATLVQVPTSIQRPVSADSSVETYLAQLEQLVLELNMELGRRDQTASDPIHDLSQRVIDLNLENLALKEQLRKSSSHE